MAVEDFFIVAIELGSSKVTGIAAKRLPNGGIQVLAMAQEDSYLFMRRGVIFNIDKTAQCLVTIVGQLEKQLKRRISGVYIGIGGQSLRGIQNTERKTMDTDVIISQEMVDSLLDINLSNSMTDLDILDVVPQEYQVGKVLQLDPVGIMSNQIEGRFLNIVARTSLSANISTCFEQAGIQVIDSFISPLALADGILSSTEKRSGCVLVDIGADTTTVSIYKSSLLRHLVVIPLGSNNVSQDIVSIYQVEPQEAEELKLACTSIFADDIEDEEEHTYTLRDERKIEDSVLREIIEARVEEILTNVGEQIKLAGCGKDVLLSGIIITGGGSNFKNIEVAMRQYTGFEKIRIAKDVLFEVNTTRQEILTKDGRYNTILSLLVKGNENCCGGDIKSEDLFSNENADSPQSRQPDRLTDIQRQREVARAKKEAEEAEKIRKEQERVEEEKKQKEEEKEEKRRRKKARWTKIKKKVSKIGGKIKELTKDIVEE